MKYILLHTPKKGYEFTIMTYLLEISMMTRMGNMEITGNIEAKYTGIRQMTTEYINGTAQLNCGDINLDLDRGKIKSLDDWKNEIYGKTKYNILSKLNIQIK